MKKLNQKGFGLWEVLLLILILLILIFLGWWVWQQQKQDKPAGDSAQQQSSEKKEEPTEVKPKEETDDWVLYITPKKEFQVRLPDGWKLERYQDSAGFYASNDADIVYTKDVDATVTQVEGGRDFSGIPLGVSYAKTADLSDPQGDKQSSSLTTKQGVTIDKYKYIVTTDPEIMGPPKGTTEFTYRIKKGDYSINVVHDVQSGGTDQTNYIEKSLQTVEFL